MRRSVSDRREKYSGLEVVLLALAEDKAERQKKSNDAPEHPVQLIHLVYASPHVLYTMRQFDTRHAFCIYYSHTIRRYRTDGVFFCP